MTVEAFNANLGIVLRILHKQWLPLIVLELLPEASLTLAYLGLELAYFLDLLLLLVSLAVYSAFDLVAPDLVALKKAGAVAVLVRELLAFGRHLWLKCAFFKLFELFFEASLENFRFLGLVSS